MAAAIPWIVSNAPAITTVLQGAALAKGLWDAFRPPTPPPICPFYTSPRPRDRG